MTNPHPSRVEVTPESLRAAVATGSEAISALIRGPHAPSDHEAILGRTQRALDILRTDLADLQNREKTNVISAMERTMEEQISIVQESLRGQANARLQELQRRMENVRRHALDEKRAVAGPFEKAVIEAREIRRDLAAGDWKMWALYGSVAVGSGLAAKWLWDHTIGWLWGKAVGSKRKPGALRRAASWIVGLGAAATGAYVLSRHRNSGQPYGDPRTLLGAALGTGAGVIGEAERLSQRTAEVATENASFFADIVRAMREGKWQEAIELCGTRGISLLWEDGKYVFYDVLGGRWCELNIELAEKFTRWMKTGKPDHDIWYVWGASGFAYVIGQKAWQALLYGRLGARLSKGGLALTALKMAAGPIAPAWDGARIAVGSLCTLTRAQGGQALKIAYVSQSNPVRVATFLQRNWIGRGLRSEADIARAVEHWKVMQSHAEITNRFSRGFGWQFTREEAARAAEAAKDFAVRIKNAVAAMPRGTQESAYLQDLRRIAALGDDAFVAQLDAVRAAAQHVAPTASRSAVVRAADLIKLKGGETVEQILSKLDPALSRAIRGSKRVMNALSAAAKSKTPESVQRILRAVAVARNIKVPLVALGLGLDVLGMYAAYCDWVEYGQKAELAKGEGNAALMELYRDARVAHSVGGAATSMSSVLIVGGFALKAIGATATGAALTSAGIVILHVTLAAAVGLVLRKQLDDAAENWLKDEKQWKHLTPGELLRKLEELGPGQSGTISGTIASLALSDGKDAAAAAATIGIPGRVSSIYASRAAEKGFEVSEDANACARFKITRAYVVKVAALKVGEPPEKSVTESDADFADRKKEWERTFRQRYDQYITDAMWCIDIASHGKFDLWQPEVFEDAFAHARLCAVARELQTNGWHHAVEIPNTDGTKITVDLADYTNLRFAIPKKNDRAREQEHYRKHAVLAAYRAAETGEFIAEVKTAQKSPATQVEAREQMRLRLIDEIRIPLARCDARILGANFAGLLWKEDRARRLARVYVSEQLRSKLLQHAADLVGRGTDLNAEELRHAVADCRAFLTRDPLSYQREAEAQGFDRSPSFTAIENGRTRNSPASSAWTPRGSRRRRLGLRRRGGGVE